MPVRTTKHHFVTALLVSLTAGLLSMSVVQADNFGGNSTSNPPIPDLPDEPCKDSNVQQCCNDGPTSGNPISYFDGGENLSYTDMTVRGVFPIRIQRRYDSNATYDSPLGYGWAFQHDRRLFEYPDGSVIIRSGCGKKNRFEFTGGAYQKPRDGVQADLTENPDGTFELRGADGSRDVYDAEGRLILTENTKGQQHEFIYDAAGRLPLTGTSPFTVDPNAAMTVAYVYQVTRIQERGKDGTLTGYFVDFSYDATTGRVTQITASDGRTVSYQHDDLNGLTRGNLVQVTGLENIVQSFGYTDPFDAHNVTSIQKHANATAVINTYDSLGRVVQQDYGDQRLVFNYIIDYGKTEVSETIKDDQGVVTGTVVTTYEFDEAGYFTKVTDALGHETVHIYDANKDRTRTEIWEKQPDTTLILLQAKDFTYDGMSRKLTQSVTLDSGEIITRTWTYDHGWVASEQVVSDADPIKLFRTEYTFYYDGNGQPTNIASMKRRKDDGTFITTSYDYDNQGRLLTTTLPDGVQMWNEYTGAYVTRAFYKDALGVEIASMQRQFDYDAKGNRNKEWDARVNLTQYEFDNLNRLTKMTNALAEETHYTYTDTNLNLIEVGRTVAEGEGQVIEYVYDGKNRRTNVNRKDDGGVFLPYQSFAYDSRGQLLEQTDALTRTTKFQYDLLGQMTQVTDPLNNTTVMEFDAAGNQTKVTDALLRNTEYRFDNLNRLIETEQLGILPSALTKNTYDASGNMTSLTDPENNQHQFSYDALSRRTLETRPLGETISFAYTDRSQLDYKINARGQRLGYDYFDWGGVEQERHYADSAGTSLIRTITYAYNLDGQPNSTADDTIQPGELYTTVYDALGRVDSITVKYIPGADKLLSYQYDRYSNRATLTLDDGVSSQHGYIHDKRNRLTDVTLPGNQAFVLTYTEADERDTISYPNGITTSYTYTLNGPIDTITTKTSADVALEQWDYSYNAVLNIEDITSNDGLTGYAYDDLDRLTGAVYPAASPLTDESYEYDRVGNREDPSDANIYGYDGNNQITASPGLTYGFDADGNMVNRSDGAILTYDAINRMLSFVGTNTADYQYEPAGRRISKVVNGTTTTWFLWDGTKLLAEYDGAGNRVNRYAYMSGDYSPLQMENADGIYSVHYDHLQTPKLMTDGSEVVIWFNRMQAFGESDVDEDPDADLFAVILNTRFPGQYFDVESGLFYNVLRDFDPSTGRYVENDPIGISGGTNTFLYANSSPNAYIDPLGLQTINPRTGRPNSPLNPGLNFPGGNNRRGPRNPIALNPGGASLAGAIGNGADAANEVSSWAKDLPCYSAIGLAVAEFQKAYFDAVSKVQDGCESQYCSICLTWKKKSFGCGSLTVFSDCRSTPGTAISVSDKTSAACMSFVVSGQDTGNQCRNCN